MYVWGNTTGNGQRIEPQQLDSNTHAMGAVCCSESQVDFDGPVELAHFSLQRSVGKGSFGKVRIVQHKKTKEIFALKYINKLKCIGMKAVENIIQERRILEEAQSAFIVNMRYAFQDDENLFMVLDLMLGGDLRFHLDRLGTFKENQVKFIVAEISLALTFLHNRNIIHRDIKPDNILLDGKGHAHLTDFNIAVRFKKEKPLTAVAGSMAYMAPEILVKKGYYSSVDWWSLGIVAYELLGGRRPFRGKNNDALVLAIKKGAFTFNSAIIANVSEEGRNAISELLEVDITKRLGCGENEHDAIRDHPWFKDMDWELIARKEATPPFQPDPSKANFDATHELEELFLEDHPLKVKKRKRVDNENGTIKPKFGEDPTVTKQLQLMEKKFKDYDYTLADRGSFINHQNNNLSQDTKNESVQKLMEMPAMGTGTDSLSRFTNAPTTHRRHRDGEESFHRDVMEGKDVEDLLRESELSEKDSDEQFKDNADNSPISGKSEEVEHEEEQ